MSTAIPIFGPEIDQKVAKTAARPISSSARGGLEPAFRVLFSAIFRGVSLGISIRVESGGFSRKKNCGVLWRLYIQIFYMYGSFCLSTGISKIPV
jgi:hypothetical protein